MSEILFHYQKINPTTWVYVSSLLMFGLFFQFNRFWSVRNLDLVLLILLAPGLLMVNEARVLTKPLKSSHKESVVAASTAAADTEVATTSNQSALEESTNSAAAAPSAAHEEIDAGDRLAR